MEDFAVITPTRGKERKDLVDFLQQRFRLANHIIVDYEPVNHNIDLIPRIKKGIEVAKSKYIDKIYILENDDFYRQDYFEQLTFEEYEFIGYQDTWYYNIKESKYQKFYHQRRSSLFCTGFRISALSEFVWPEDNSPWLDIALWKFAFQNNKKVKLLDNNPNIGIKAHGIGKAAGKGHCLPLRDSDQDFKFLSSMMDKESFDFYTSL